MIFLDASPSSTENRIRLRMTDVPEVAPACEMSRIGPRVRIIMALTLLAVTGAAVVWTGIGIEPGAARQAVAAVAGTKTAVRALTNGLSAEPD